MKKGTVLSIDKRHAVVFTQDCQLLRLPLTPDMIAGKEIRLEASGLEPLRIDWYRLARPAMAAVALLVIVAIALWSASIGKQDLVYAYVSIDVKPSIQLLLDPQLNVSSVEVLDDASAILANDLLLIGEPWQQAVNVWLARLAEESDLSQETILISAIFPEKADRMREPLEAINGHNGTGVLTGLDVHVAYSSDFHLVAQARANHLTIGRQMLLIKSNHLSQPWDASSILSTPLSILVHTLLSPEVTRVTTIEELLTESVLNPSDSVSGASEQTAEATQSTSRVVENAQTSGSGSESAKGSSQESSTETQGATASSEASTAEPQGSQQTESSTSSSSEPDPSTQRQTSTQSSSSAESETTAEMTNGPGPSGPSPSTSGNMGRRMGRFAHQKV